jgi:steroid 5-alpha reductase family enzyme
MTGEIWRLIGTNLAVVLVVMSAVAVPSFRTKDPSYVDAFWGVGFLVVAVSSLLQTDGDGARSGVLVVVTALWGLRLGGYLLLRWRRNGPDPRYQKMLGADAPAVRIWGRVFVVQAVVLTVVSLPVQLGQVYDRPVGLQWWNVLGLVVAVLGIAFEATADRQLKRFKAAPGSEGQVMDRGLWAYSRHPNYFGEACTWWGLFLVAVVNVPTAFAAIGPLLITAFLLKWSGVGPLESQLRSSKPKYVDYIAATSGFVPLPRRNPAKAAAKVKAQAGVS